MIAAVQQWVSQRVSFRALVQGLIAVLLIYCSIFVYVLFAGNSALEKIEAKLPGQTVKIDRMGAASNSSAPEHHTIPKPVHQEHAEAVPHQETEVSSEPAAHGHDETHAPEDESHEATMSGRGLPRAPNKEVIEIQADGKFLPKISVTGLTPFDAYKRPFTLANVPVIAVAIEDFGLSRQSSEEALEKLPPEISLLLSPYSDVPEDWVKAARENGHEVWLQLPVQNSDFPETADTGPQTLMSSADLQYNNDRMIWALKSSVGYVGVAAQTDPLFMYSKPVAKAILTSVFSRGLGFLELNPDNPAFIETAAVAENIPYAKNTILIGDSVQDHAALFERAEAEASGGGYAIVVIELYPANLEALVDWLSSLEKKGLQLAPVSAVASLGIQQPAKQHE